MKRNVASTMRSRSLNSLARTVILTTFASCVPLTHADNYPSRPVRFIVAFPPGGNVDLMGRIAAQKLTEAVFRKAEFARMSTPVVKAGIQSGT